MHKKNQFAIFIFIICVVLLVGCISFVIFKNIDDSDRPKDQVKMDQKLDEFKKDNHIITRGSKFAKDDVVVFVDYRCPDCYNFHKKYFKKIENQIKQNNIQYTEIPYSFIDKYSEQLAKLDIAGAKILNQHQYIDLKTLIYNESRKKQPNIDNILKHFSRNEQNQLVNEHYKYNQYDINKFGKEIHLKETPTIYINGEKLKSYDELEQKLR